LLHDLLGLVKVAVISGGSWPQFEKQLLSTLPHDARLANLFLLPTCGTQFFRYAGDWTRIYSEDLTADEKGRIVSALRGALELTGSRAAQVWGEVIEDRGSQITLSALGQQAPLAEKERWDPDFTKRTAIKAVLDSTLPEFSVRMGGATSIDVTKPGIDKAYGIRKRRDLLGISLAEMIFIGDALIPGGNDHPAREAGLRATFENSCKAHRVHLSQRRRLQSCAGVLDRAAQVDRAPERESGCSWSDPSRLADGGLQLDEPLQHGVERTVLNLEVPLDLLRLVQRRSRILECHLGALVRRLPLDVLPHDDDGEHHELDERLADPLHQQ
jgi:HAD superfamily hydrolase (TIGR01484 family)